MKKEEKVDINCIKFAGNCKFCPKNENCEKDKDNKVKQLKINEKRRI